MRVHKKALKELHKANQGKNRTHRVRLQNWEKVRVQLLEEQVEFQLVPAAKAEDQELFLGVKCQLSANKFHTLLQRAGVV